MMFFFFLVNRVKNDTGVIINISESDNNSNIIRIEGRKDGVEMAKSVRYYILIVHLMYIICLLYKFVYSSSQIGSHNINIIV